MIEMNMFFLMGRIRASCIFFLYRSFVCFLPPQEAEQSKTVESAREVGARPAGVESQSGRGAETAKERGEEEDRGLRLVF